MPPLDSAPAPSPPGPPLQVDLLVVGGGINGTGIARDAAGRGLSVLLCEKDDLAQGTSSRSSRLIHGGLRYLEHGELRLVREALREREVLLRIAPHLVRPQRFVLPQAPHMRPAWMLRAGLFLYDHLARRRTLPGSSALALDRVPEGAAVRPELRRGFAYYDCRADDARLVVANARGAQVLGASIRTRTELLEAERGGPLGWLASLRGADGGLARVAARALVNAAGPWIEALHPRVRDARPRHHALLVKGSHIVVPKFWQGEHAYLLQHADRRVIFATPYEEGHAMIGTTDLAYAGAPEQVAITPGEIDYLCGAVNAQLRCALGPADLRHRYAGVRCLLDDEQANPSAVTRDYLIDVDGGPDRAPYLTVLGGKITTFRRLAEHALADLRPWLPGMGAPWTAERPLPGGALPDRDRASAEARFLAEHPGLPPAHARGLFARHGAEAWRIAQGADSPGALGRDLGGGLYEREAEVLMQEEWACNAEDLLWRRTKCGLTATPGQCAGLERWLAQRGA